MSENKQKVSTSSLIITVVAALLAIAALIFLMITMSKAEEKENENAANTVTEAESMNPVLQSAEVALSDLINKNLRAYSYFTEGTATEGEPYGNRPEDGLYTCDDPSFKTFDEFSEFIRGIYTEQTAAKLLTDPFGNGPIYADRKGKLGISADFMDGNPTDKSLLVWENGNNAFTLTLISDTECKVQITLKDKDGKEAKIETKMILENDVWKLSEMLG